jgi:hypothetical protein
MLPKEDLIEQQDVSAIAAGGHERRRSSHLLWRIPDLPLLDPAQRARSRRALLLEVSLQIVWRHVASFLSLIDALELV